MNKNAVKMAAFFQSLMIFIKKIFTYMKKIIRLTEGDLHRIVKCSVNKILRESVLDDYDEAEKRLRIAREKGNTKEIIAAAQEWNRLKSLAKSEIEARNREREREAEENFTNKNKEFINSQMQKASELISFFASGFGVYNDMEVGGLYTPFKKKGEAYNNAVTVLKDKLEEAEEVAYQLENTLLLYKEYFDHNTQETIRYEIKTLNGWIKKLKH